MDDVGQRPAAGDVRRGWGHCGCWSSLNARPDLDLRHGMHGWAAHDRHEAGRVRHAWCDVCSPANAVADRDHTGPGALGRA